MSKIVLVSLVMLMGLVFCAGDIMAKGNSGEGKGKKKRKRQQQSETVQPSSVGENRTISGRIAVDGDVVKLVADDGKEYQLAASTAMANKEKNGQKVAITGTVTEIEGRSWFSGESAASSGAGQTGDGKGGGQGGGKGGKSAGEGRASKGNNK